MDINDYSTRLSQAREDYHDKSKELRENYQRDLSQVEDTHKSQKENQVKAYNEAKNRMERETSRMTEEQVKTSKEELARLQNDFNRQRNIERVEFDQDSAKKRNDFAQRLRNIQESYQDSSRRSEVANQEKVDRIKSNLESRLENNAIESNRSIEDIQRKGSQKYGEYRDKVSDEKKDLLKGQGARVTSIIEDNNKKIATLKDKNKQFNQEVNRVHQDQHKNTIESYEERIGEQVRLLF